MNILGLFGKKEWFYYDSSDHSKGSVCLQMPTSEDLEKCKLATLGQGVTKRGQAIMCATIVNWKNIQIDSKIAEYNDINKTKLVQIPDFVAFVVDCMKIIADRYEAIADSLEE